jgi:hypothetical protein
MPELTDSRQSADNRRRPRRSDPDPHDFGLDEYVYEALRAGASGSYRMTLPNS